MGGRVGWRKGGGSKGILYRTPLPIPVSSAVSSAAATVVVAAAAMATSISSVVLCHLVSFYAWMKLVAELRILCFLVNDPSNYGCEATQRYA